MKKVFLFLALVLLIPLTAMAAESSGSTDSQWIIEKATQNDLCDMDYDAVTQQTPLEKLQGKNSLHIATKPHVKNFVETYVFDENNKLLGILLLTPVEKNHKELEKDLIRALGAPDRSDSNKMGWIKGKNIIISYFIERDNMYAVGIADFAAITN